MLVTDERLVNQPIGFLLHYLDCLRDSESRNTVVGEDILGHIPRREKSLYRIGCHTGM